MTLSDGLNIPGHLSFASPGLLYSPRENQSQPPNVNMGFIEVVILINIDNGISQCSLTPNTIVIRVQGIVHVS